MTRRWHYLVLLAAILVGLLIVFWPAPVTEETPAETPETAPAEKEAPDSTQTQS